jgi:hypothetical protein
MFLTLTPLAAGPDRYISINSEEIVSISEVDDDKGIEVSCIMLSNNTVINVKEKRVSIVDYIEKRISRIP